MGLEVMVFLCGFSLSWLFLGFQGEAEPLRLLEPSMLQDSEYIIVDELSPMQVRPYDILLSKSWLEALYVTKISLSRDRPPTNC